MNSRDRRAIIGGGAILVSLGVIWFALIPWLDSWGAARRDIALSRQRMAELQRQVQSLAALDRPLAVVYGDAVTKPLPSFQDARTALVKNVLDLYGRAGIQLGSLTPQAPRVLREVPGVTRLTVQAQGMAQSPQLVQLMAAARSSAGLLMLDRIEVTTSPQGPGPMTITAEWSTLARQESGQ
jgi:hypothetical protein